jgi:iron complex outermembrane receptor protein
MTNEAKRRRRRLILSTCVAAAGFAAPLAVRAADPAPPPGAAAGAPAPGAQVGEVIVTAERRAVDIQKSPLAITALSPRQLDAAFVNNAQGLNGLAPGLEITKASGFENLVSIRGVGSETPENSLTTVPGVSLFIDGVYIANTISLDQSLFDISDIEVLRGPQGALYGESSIGGAIIINTIQPQLNTFSGKADFSAGNYDLFRERGEVNIPIGDQFALVLSAQKYDHDGFTQDVAIPGFRLDDAHDESGKAELLWKPNDHFSATLTGEIYQSDQHGDAQKNINDPEPSPWQVFQDYPAHFRLTTQLYHLNLEYDGPWFEIKSVSAYQDLEHTQKEDSSRSAYSLIGEWDDVAAWNTAVHNMNQEIDILSLPGAKFQWIGGVFVMQQTTHQFVEEFECTTSAFQAPCPAPPPYVYGAIPALETETTSQIIAAAPSLAYGNNSHAVHKTAAVFAQGTYPILDNLRITGGIRYNYDYDADPSRNFAASGTSFADNKATTSEPTWRLEADWDVTSDNMLYLSGARGYKPGGANGSIGQAVVQPTFLPETSTAVEFGSKNLFLDQTLRLNASLFYAIHDNFQYIETDPAPFLGGIANVPRVDTYGAEFEGNWTSPDTHLRIEGNLALEHGEVVGTYRTIDSTIANMFEGPNFTGGFEDATFGPCAYYADYGYGYTAASRACYAQVEANATNVAGKSPPDMPNVSGSVAASYRFDFPWGSITPRIQEVYRGSEWARIFNAANLDWVPSYEVTNVYIEFAPTNSRLRLTLTGTNIFDVAGINSKYTDPYGTFTTSEQFIAPAQVIGTIAYSW